MTRVPSLSIRQLLPALVFATALPLVILAFVMNQRIADRERAVTREALMAQTVAVGLLIDNEIDTHLAIGTTLATSQQLRTGGNPADFIKRAQDALQIVPGSWLTLTDPSGLFLASTSPNGQTGSVTAEQLTVATRALLTRQPQVSDVTTDPITQSKSTFVAVPVFHNGAPLFIIYIGLNPARFQALIRSDPAYTVGLLDRKRHFVARQPDQGSRIGTPASSGWQAAIDKASTGFAFNETLEGLPSLTAYVRTRDGWTIGRSVALETLDAPVRRLLWSMATLSLALLGISLLLGAMLAKQLSSNMLALSRSAHRMGLGQTVSAQPLLIREAEGISEVLAQTSQQLANRQAALVESETQFRGTFENAAVGMAHVAPDGTWLLVNPRLCEIAGSTPDKLMGSRIQDLPCPDDRPASDRALTEVLAGQIAVQELEIRFARPDGSLVWVAVTLSLRREANGRAKYVICVIRDINERREAQEHQKFLLSELAHRSKNQLAVIQAIANQTTRASKTLPEFRKNFADRLNAMSVSTDLLIAQNWTGVQVADLVERILETFVTRPEQLILDGPPVMLTADASQAIGLALHELGTNCVKHGAWSSSTGIVTLAWRRNPNGLMGSAGAEPHLATGDKPRNHGLAADHAMLLDHLPILLTWVERGGPTVTAPRHSGFGQVVIEQMVAQKVNGAVDIDYASIGLTWSLTIPANNFSTPAIKKI